MKEALPEKGIPEKTVRLLSITNYQLVFMEFSKHPRIIDRIWPLIGEDIQFEHSKLASKSPASGNEEFHWHQDFVFFPHTNTDLVAVMLDDATPENECMQIDRGSHRWRFVDHTLDGYFLEVCQEPERWSDPHYIANVEPRAGGISIHHCLALHGSDPILSGKRRRGLVLQYCADNAYQQDADTVFEDTGILVSGIRRERVRCDKGAFGLPKCQNPDRLFGTAWNQAGPIGREVTYDVDGPEA